MLVAWGVRESSLTNNVFTALNLLTVSTVIITGIYKGNLNILKKKNEWRVYYILFYVIISIILLLFTYYRIAFVFYYFFISANFDNWSIPKSEIPPEANGGEGGFLPYGWVGVAAGAAKCFYGFIGFDSIATTGNGIILF